MTSWVNPKIIIQNVDRKGIGSFAGSPISKDEVIIVQGGKIMDYKQILESDYKSFNDHCFQIEKDLLVCPTEPKTEYLDGVFQVNHSCHPNCGFKGQIVLVAMKDIQPGEEITYDYAMTDANRHHVTCTEMECFCGTDTCRHVITGDDWKNEDLQKKYKGFFSAYIQEMIFETGSHSI